MRVDDLAGPGQTIARQIRRGRRSRLVIGPEIARRLDEKAGLDEIAQTL